MENPLWPGGKKCAVMFSFDLDGDTTWENGNRGLPYGDQYIKSLSVGQYGPKRGVYIYWTCWINMTLKALSIYRA